MCWAKIAEGPIFGISVSFAVLAMFVLHHATGERTSKRKLLQMVSGLKLGAFWFGNWLFDACSMLLLVGVTIACYVVFDPIWRVSISVVIIFPIVTVPVIYAYSFFVLQPGVSVALITAMLFVLLCVSQAVFTSRMQSSSEFIGDCLMWFFRSFPGYPLINSLYIEATAKPLNDLRVYTKSEDNGTAKIGNAISTSIFNVSGDIAMSTFQLVICILLIVTMELEYVKRIKGFCRRYNFKRRISELEQSPQIELMENGIVVQDLSYGRRNLDLNKRIFFKDVSFTIK